MPLFNAMDGPTGGNTRVARWNALGKGGGGIPTQAEATAFFARQATQLSAASKAAFNRYFYDWKESGAYNDLVTLHVHAGETTADSRLNLVGTSNTITENVAATFEAALGKTCNGSSGSLAPGLVLSALPDKDHLHVGTFTTREADKNTYVGLGAASNNFLLDQSNGATTYRANDSVTRQVNTGPAVGTRHMVRDGDVTKVFINGAKASSPAGNTAPALVGQNIHFSRNVTAFGNSRFAISWIGRAAVTDAQAELINAANYRLMAALGWSPPAEPTVLIRSPTNIATLPDGASGSTSGKGFTCTGAIKDAEDGTYWVCNYGLTTAGAPSGGRTASIVHLDNDGPNGAPGSYLGEITLASLGLTATNEVQGVCEDTTDNTIFFANVTTSSVYQISKAGALLATLSSMGVINGLAYNSVNDTLIVGSATTIQERSKSTGAAAGILYRLTAGGAGGGVDLDQLFFDASNNRLFATTGNNGSAGAVYIYTLSNDYGYPVLSKIVSLTGFNAAEGIVLDGTTLYGFSDEYFHGSAGDVNRVLTYDFTGV